MAKAAKKEDARENLRQEAAPALAQGLEEIRKGLG